MVPYNWTAAFTAYVGGASLDEVSQVFAIPEERLKKRSIDEKWPVFREKILDQARALLPAVTGGAGQTSALVAQNDLLPADVRARMELVRQNREKNYKDACDLRDELRKVIEGLQSKTYKVTKLSVYKGMVIPTEMDPGPGDLVNIATFARTIADLSYRALGDAAADGQERKPDPGATNNPQAAITIILPAAIGQPRGLRQMPSDSSTVIDLRPEPKGLPTTEPEPPTDLPGK